MTDYFSTQAMARALPAVDDDKPWAPPQPIDYEALTKAPADQQWDGFAPVYEWSEEYGDVGPEMPALEEELFGLPAERKSKAGLDFSV